jgi:hypothetical protein
MRKPILVLPGPGAGKGTPGHKKSPHACDALLTLASMTAKLAWISVATLGCAFAFQSAALAAGYSTFGTRYYGQGSDGFQQYGDEMTIQVPRPAEHTVADDELNYRAR